MSTSEQAGLGEKGRARGRRIEGQRRTMTVATFMGRLPEKDGIWRKMA
jgi:hypothetical protein